MSKTIHKYKLDPYKNELMLPMFYKFLHLSAQRDDICVWLEVDFDEPSEITCERNYIVVPTGRTVINPKDLPFLGTVLLYGGDLVFHVYSDIASKENVE